MGRGRTNRVNKIKDVLYNILVYGGVVDPDVFKAEQGISERTFRVVINKLKGREDKFSRTFKSVGDKAGDKTIRIESKRTARSGFIYCPDALSEERIKLIADERVARFKEDFKAKKETSQYRKNPIVVYGDPEDGFDFGYDGPGDDAKEVWNVTQEGLLRIARNLKIEGVPGNKPKFDQYGQIEKDQDELVIYERLPATVAAITERLIAFCDTHPAGSPFLPAYLRNLAAHVMDGTKLIPESKFVSDSGKDQSEQLNADAVAEDYLNKLVQQGESYEDCRTNMILYCLDHIGKEKMDSLLLKVFQNAAAIPDAVEVKLGYKPLYESEMVAIATKMKDDGQTAPEINAFLIVQSRTRPKPYNPISEDRIREIVDSVIVNRPVVIDEGF